jgi:hypothetical protein
MDDHRIIRSRQSALDTGIDRRGGDRPMAAAARMLVQVYDGGAMPAQPDRVYFTHPVELGGDETEGGGATPVVDTTTTVPVVVVWGVPSVGDILTAYAVGGRWVAERTGAGTGPTYPCGPCQVPKKDLTVSWTNLILGNGSTTLVYSGRLATQWISGCTNELLYELVCTEGLVEFRVYYFLSGACPSGQSQSCSTIRGSPYSLTVTDLVCGTGFLLACQVTSASCPNLGSYGYTGFTVSV